MQSEKSEADKREETYEMEEDIAAAQPLAGGDAPSKVKFISPDDKNGEAKVDIRGGAQRTSLTKEELMKFANAPFWIRLRLFLLILFWVVLIALLVGAIVIVILTPKCPALETSEDLANITSAGLSSTTLASTVASALTSLTSQAS